MIGDVVGKGVAAAATMGQLRIAVRAYALERRGPSRTMAWLHQFAPSVAGAVAASVVYAELDTATGVLSYSCAGHLPPLFVPQQGAPELLWEGRGPLLGVGVADPSIGRRELQRGDTVMLYTDGLVERRGTDLVDSLDGLVSLVARRPELVHDPALLAKHLDSENHADDTCILSVLLGS